MMDVEVGERLFQGATKFDVMPTIHTGSQPCLDADFRGSELAGFTRTADDFFGRQRSEERRVGKSVDLGGRRIIKKKKKKILEVTATVTREQVIWEVLISRTVTS